MPFKKLKIWDFSRSHELFVEKEGIFVVGIGDPFIEKIIWDGIKKSHPEYEAILSFGKELNQDWLMSRSMGMGLFNEPKLFAILDAQDIHADILSGLSKLTDLSGQKIIFFVTKETKLKTFEKAGDFKGVHIAAASFWEGRKLLDFLLQVKRMTLSYDVRNYIINNFECQSEKFLQIIESIDVNYPDTSKIQLTDLEELLGVGTFNNFDFAGLLFEKKYHQFLDGLDKWSLSSDDLRSFLSFLQGHLIKVADTSYLSGKSKLSQYDKSIQSQANKWKKNELEELMRILARTEIQAKAKSSLALPILKTSILNIETRA